MTQVTKLQIEQQLLKLGIPPSIKGFRYLREAIFMYEEDTSMTKSLYPTLAQQFEATPSRVERAIRHAISKATYAWDFVNPVKGNATNQEFICYIKMHLLKEEE